MKREFRKVTRASVQPMGFLVASIAAVMLMASCSKEKEKQDPEANNPPIQEEWVCTDCPDQPEALAADDNLSSGIYKGVLVGGSGYYKLVLNTDGSLSAEMMMDEQLYPLVGEEIFGFEPGEPVWGCYLTNPELEDWVLTFSVEGNGQNPFLEILPPSGEEVMTITLKEKSDALVECYEGSFSGDYGGFQSWGAWNSIICKDQFEACYLEFYSHGGSEAGTANSEVKEGNLSGYTTDGSSFQGTIVGDVITGSWAYPGPGVPGQGTWMGYRKL